MKDPFWCLPADGRGTNAAFRRPANLFPLALRQRQFQTPPRRRPSHWQTCVVLQLPGIAVDVDNPEDLQPILQHPGETRTQTLLRRWKTQGRFLAKGTSALRRIRVRSGINRKIDCESLDSRKNRPNNVHGGLRLFRSR